MMKKQSGFTLVELAIVLMIIGLLIGGILKGQELIENARILSFVRNIKSYDAARLTFQSSYGAWPGDMTNPSTRLPDCTTFPCNNAGNGNGRLEGWDVPNYWIHLQKANMISGSSTFDIDDNPYGEISMGFSGSGRLMVWDTAYTDSYGGKTYNNFMVHNGQTGGGGISAPRAARIDHKLDDGKSETGDITAYNDEAGAASAACISGTGYLETRSDDNSCSFNVKME